MAKLGDIKIRLGEGVKEVFEALGHKVAKNTRFQTVRIVLDGLLLLSLTFYLLDRIGVL